MSAPIIEPVMLPSPPLRLPPPMTTAAMMSSSDPAATVGSPYRRRDICNTPASPKSSPASA